VAHPTNRVQRQRTSSTSRSSVSRFDGGEQFRFLDFDEDWIVATRRLP
jgi:hypothetical protein